jgi:hypothetical protein
MKENNKNLLIQEHRINGKLAGNIAFKIKDNRFAMVVDLPWWYPLQRLFKKKCRINLFKDGHVSWFGMHLDQKEHDELMDFILKAGHKARV